MLHILPVTLIVACNGIDNQVGGIGDPNDPAPILVVEPAILQFDALLLDETESLSFTMTNEGDAALEIDSLTITQTTAFTIAGDTSFYIPVGESVEVPVVFSPTAATNSGQVLIASDDPSPLTDVVDLAGDGKLPELRIVPDPYDFGNVPPGCSSGGDLTLQNSGDAPLEITSIAHSGVGFSVIQPSLPVTLEPSEEYPVEIVFAPPDYDEYEGQLFVVSNEAAGQRTAEQQGTGDDASPFIDQFIQPDGPWEMTDILFHVDRSCSMWNDADNLSSNFNDFLVAMEEIEADWQVGVVTEDNGCINGGILNADTVNVESKFRSAVFGPHQDYTEAGLYIAAQALKDSALNGGCNDGFLREDSRLSVVLISDEPDQSPRGSEEWKNEIKGTAEGVRISAVAGDVPGGCPSADEGWGYYEAAIETNGYFLSICSVDWGRNLELIAALAGEPTDTFPLSHSPDVDTLEVRQQDSPPNGSWHEETEGWTYDDSQNAIVFDADNLPPANARVEVEYVAPLDCEN